MFKSILLSSLVLVSGSLVAQPLDIFDKVNSIYDEQNPVLSPDGRTLYFTRANHPENVGGEADPGDIWYSLIQPDGQWSTPQNATALNNANWNGVLGFVGGSDVIYLYNHYSQSGGTTKTFGISRAIKTTGGWSIPENYTIPYFTTSSKIHGGYITADASTAVFSLESYGTKGGEDIYVCFNKGNGNWSEPKNLGSTINTKFQEFSPSLSDDSKMLYFATNGTGTGTDFYIAERLDDSWLNWSDPLPLILLNSDGRELGLRMYVPMYLYTSTTDSDGYGDIKAFIDPNLDDQEEVQTDTLKVVDPVVIKEKKPVFDSRFITLYGNTYNSENKNAIETKITLKSMNDESIASVNSHMGSYALKIEAIGNYRVRVDAPGYVSHQETLELQSDEIKSFEMNFYLQPIHVGATVNLKDVLFKQSRAEFLESSFAELNLVVDFMRDNPKVEIRLEGHTDNRGIEKYNIKLSKERVEAVKDYLVKKGISKKRISGKGYGGSRPIADNENPQTRILNRRVEFTIVKN
ncbi:MAG: OmpA family protein [Fulvivirga sp.]|uniref:OmpA family protein n=1 Tax=Fulvivirga sp. TaxID=1931237 RepID=UPI0032EE6691